MDCEEILINKGIVANIGFGRLNTVIHLQEKIYNGIDALSAGYWINKTEGGEHICSISFNMFPAYLNMFHPSKKYKNFINNNSNKYCCIRLSYTPFFLYVFNVNKSYIDSVINLAPSIKNEGELLIFSKICDILKGRYDYLYHKYGLI